MQSLLFRSVAALAVATTSAATAAEEPRDLEEVVVTAQRRTEVLEKVPMAISVVSADRLSRAGVTSVVDLGRIATGVQFNYAGAVPVVAIRGISTLVSGNNVEPNVATYVDGFYNPNPQAIATDLANLESVQVLKGPQGTLYGRNATGGAILINTRGPSQTYTGAFDASYASFDNKILNGFIAGPISDRVRFSVGLHGRHSDGYIKLVDPTAIGRTAGDAAHYEEFSGRAKLQVDVTDKLGATIGYSHTYFDDPRVELFSPLDHVPPTFPAPPLRPTKVGEAAYTYEPYHRGVTDEGTLKLDYQTSIGVLNSFTGYAERANKQGFDFDGTYADLTWTTTRFRERTFQQAVDYNVTAIRNVDLVLGGLYYTDFFGTPDVDGITQYQPGQRLALTTHPKQWTRAWALYADATWSVNDRLSLAAGGRYSDDHKRMEFNAVTPTGVFTVPETKSERSWSEFTPRVTARYELAPHMNVWAAWSRGFRSGTYNFSGPNALGLVPVDPETVDSYELGFKMAASAIRLQTSVFYYDYKNIQTSVTIPNPLCPPNTVCSALTTLQNAKGAEVYGWEGELTYQATDRLTLHAGVVAQHGRYKSFPNATGTGVNASNTLNVPSQVQDWTGKRMVRAPDVSGNAGFDFEQPLSYGSLLFSSNVSFTSTYPLQNASLYGPLAPAELQDKQRLPQKRYALLSAQLTWTDPSNHYSVTVYGNNLTDHTYYLFYNAGPFGDYKLQADPREIGGRVSYRF